MNVNASAYMVGMVERDPNPLPDVKSGLFSDFSFGRGEEVQSQSSMASFTANHARPDLQSQSQDQSHHPPPSISALSSVEADAEAPLDIIGGGVPVLPDVSGAGNEAGSLNTYVYAHNDGESREDNRTSTGGTGRLLSMDISACMHLDLDGVYALNSGGVGGGYDVNSAVDVMSAEEYYKAIV